MPFTFKLSRRLAHSRRILFCALVAAGCEDSNLTAPPPQAPFVIAVHTVLVSPTVAAPAVSETQQFQASLLDSAGDTLSGRSITWSTSDTSVAIVDPNGLVMARSTGSATILAASGGQTGSGRVDVAPRKISTISITPSPLVLTPSHTQQLTVTLRAANGDALTGRAISWSASDTTIATVSSSGLVTARATGTAAVTAASEGKSGSASVTVSPAPVAAVSVTPSAASLRVGATLALLAATQDADGNTLTGRTMTWSSANPSVAAVNGAGMVTGVAPGSTLITVTSEGKSASASLAVSLVPVTSLTVTPAASNLLVSQTQQLSATTKDSTGSILSGRPISWTTSNSAVVTISASGLALAVAPGTATLTATSEGKSGTATATVSLVPVASVTLIPASSNLYIGQAVQLTAITNDSAGGTLAARSVTWSSSSTTVASVSGSGFVTGNGVGSVTITATSEGRSGTATVAVARVPVARVSVSPTAPSIVVGATVQLGATTFDSAGNVLTGRTVTWSSASTTVATVSSSGLVTGKATGAVVITATSETKAGTASVTVVQPSVASVSVTPTTATLSVGATLLFSATAFDSAGHAIAGASITWSSTTPSTATVSSTGLVTGLAAGTTVISATSNGKNGTAAVGVSASTGGTCTPTGSGICRYVDVAAGNDANPGTATQPYRTLQKAAGVVNPGDVVIVRDGIYTGGSGAVLSMGRGGTSTNLVVFKAEHQWGAIIDGQNNTSAQGIAFGANYERVEGFEIRGIAHDGVDMNVGLTGLQAAGLHIHDVGRMCVPPSGWGLSAFTVDDQNVIIEQNLIHDIGRYGPGENGCTPTTPYYQNNDHGIYLSSGTNITIRNNIFYNIQHGWAVHRYNTGGAGTDQIYIVNNTFAFPNPWRDGQIVISDPMTNSVIANNIFYQPATAAILYTGTTLSNLSVSHNITYGGVIWTGGSNSGVTLSSNMDNTDPRLVNASALNFHLLSGSPAIVAGLALPYVLDDFAGSIRASGSEDIGAYKY